MAKDDMNKLDSLAEKIEEAFLALQTVMKQINEISSIADNLESASKKINTKYLDILDSKKFETLKETSNKALEEILKDIKRIDDAILSIDVLKQQTTEAVAALSKRIGTYEENLRISKETAREVDDKLVKILKSAENAQTTGEKRILTASKLLEASAEVEKYDELLKIENENNRLLRDVLGKISSLEKKGLKPLEGIGIQKKPEEPKKPNYGQPK
jgi:glutamine synthetase adenylyltransferase